MPLQAGDRIGLFEILSVLGVGGMGEVYRAHDTKLHRDVAIKILPPAFAADGDRLTRFEREAQVLASLSHPHIAQIYGIVDLPDLLEGAGFALVLERVEGEDLAHRLQRGPLSLEDALPLARQIAEALETAHDHGIVHRDLKPANIKIAPDGTAKVLDFGLATADPVGDRAGVGSPDSPTFTSPVALTARGMVLGTATYMAPEQARGKPVDRRADIWAFGCVLYEMLTGRSPFSGPDLAETLAAITRDSPDWGPLPTGVPSTVRALLERCLEKNPRERLRDIGEARIALSRPPGPATPPPVMAPPSRWPARLAWGTVGLIAGALAMLAWTPPASVESSAAFSLRQLTEQPGEEIHPDISPDGRLVAYTAGPAGRRDIYLLRVGGRAINLTADSPADDSQPAFSRDGERIAFRSERDGGGIFVMGVTGESVKRVTTSGFDPRWSPDGRRLVYATEAVIDPYSRAVRSEVWTADVTAGTASRLWDGDAVQPAWSPHSTRIAFWALTGGQRDIWTIPASGGTPVAVVSDDATDWAPEWSPDGGTLYFVSDRGGAPNLWQVAIDETTGVPRSVPTAVTNGVRALGSARISGDGSRMVVSATDRAAELSLVGFDAAAGRLAVGTTIRSSSLGWCNPSHDAVWLACTSRIGHEDIVLLRSDGTETRRLTDDAFKDRVPVWSPDDRTIAFMSARNGRWGLWAIGADGSALRPLTDLRVDIGWGIWSPDGKRMAAGTAVGGAPPYGIWLLNPSRPSTPDTAVLVPTHARIDMDTWSSDGTLLAGTEKNSAGDLIAVTIWNVDARRMVNRIELPLIRGSAYDVSFVPGTHDMLVSTTRGVMLVNAETGHSRLISPLIGELSGAGRTLLLERTTLDADLWLIEFQK